MALVPAREPVIASFPFLARLTERGGLYAFYKVYTRSFNAPENKFHLPDDVAYALIDDRDPWYQGALAADHEFVKGKVEDFFIQGGWQLLRSSGPISLYRRGVR